MSTFLAWSMPGWPETLLIAFIILIVFGAKRLPELARGLGQSMNEFRKAREEFDREIHKSTSTADVKIQEPKDKQPHNPV